MKIRPVGAELFHADGRTDGRTRRSFHKEKSNKMQQYIQNFIIPYLYEAQHVSGDTPPIIRSLKLHWQPLVLHTWKVVGRVVGGRCQTVPTHIKTQRLSVQF